MSYILEALRKMERQRRHESEPESWVEDLSTEPEEGRAARKSPGLIIIVVSIFFGICGVLTGMLLYQGDGVPGPDEKIVAQNKPLPQSHKAETPSKDQDDRKGGEPTPIPLPREQKTEKNSLPKPRGVTLSAIKDSQPTASPPPKKEAAKEPALPPILPDEVNGKQEIGTKSDVQDPLPGKKKDVMEGAVLLKSDTSLPEKIFEESTKARAIDLSRKYKLTSTGEVNDRKYATIDRDDYFIGETFMGMAVTDIQRDRVYLRKDGSPQRYVIIFRY